MDYKPLGSRIIVNTKKIVALTHARTQDRRHIYLCFTSFHQRVRISLEGRKNFRFDFEFRVVCIVCVCGTEYMSKHHNSEMSSFTDGELPYMKNGKRKNRSFPFNLTHIPISTTYSFCIRGIFVFLSLHLLLLLLTIYLRFVPLRLFSIRSKTLLGNYARLSVAIRVYLILLPVATFENSWAQKEKFAKAY